MKQTTLMCEGHGREMVLADLVVNIRFVGSGGRPFTYSLCIDCAEAHYDLVQRWDGRDRARVRDYWWAKHPNCAGR